jgi:YD repeat-containing protein
MKTKKIVLFSVIAVLIIAVIFVSLTLMCDNKKNYIVTSAEIKTLSETSNINYVYDKNGHIIKITANGEDLYTYEYSEDYKKVTVNNIKANATRSYTFNDNFDIVEQTNYDNSTQTFEYNKNGRLIKSRNSYGVDVLYDYKGKKLTGERYSNGDSVEYVYSGKNLVGMFIYNNNVKMSSTYYYYDNKNNLERKDDDLGSINYYYNDKNQLIKKQTTDGDLINYTYDEYGNILSINYMDINQMTYSYKEFTGTDMAYMQNKILITYNDAIERTTVQLLQ